MKKLPKNKRKVKVGMSLAPDLFKWINQQAKQEGRPRSSMIERMLWRAMKLAEKGKVQEPTDMEKNLTEQQKEIVRRQCSR